MKVFFDTNVYVAEALLGDAAVRMLDATVQAKWRIHLCRQVLNEIEQVLVDELRFTRRLAKLTQARAVRRAILTEPGASPHNVPDDPKDNPILQAAMSAGVDYLVTNDQHLLSLHPYEGLQILSMTKFHELLVSQGLLRLT
jgi:putative PIN family toxin of toxin-antitoxin system